MCPPGPWRLRPVHTTKRASAPELGLQARGWMSAQCARGETEGRKDRGSPSRMEGDHPDAAELRSQPASCSTGTGWKGSSGRRRTFGRVRASGDGTAENMTRPPLSVCASAPLWIALKHSAGATTCSGARMHCVYQRTQATSSRQMAGSKKQNETEQRRGSSSPKHTGGDETHLRPE